MAIQGCELDEANSKPSSSGVQYWIYHGLHHGLPHSKLDIARGISNDILHRDLLDQDTTRRAAVERHTPRRHVGLLRASGGTEPQLGDFGVANKGSSLGRWD